MTADHSTLETTQSLALRLLPMIRRQRLKILAVTLVAIVASSIGVGLMQPIYQAEATLLVKFGREYVYRPEVGDRDNWAPSTLENPLNTEVEILASRDLKMRVLEALEISTIYPEISTTSSPAEWSFKGVMNRLRRALGLPDLRQTPLLERALAKFDADLVVTAVLDSDVLHLDYRNADPDVARRVLELLIRFAAEKRMALYAETDVSLLDAQLAAYRSDVEQADQDLEEFKRANDLYTIDAQLAKLAQSGIELETAVATTANRLAALQQAAAAIEDKMRKLLGNDRLFTDSEEEATTTAEKRLLDLQRDEAEFAVSVPQAARFIAELRAEEELVKAEIDQRRASLLDKLSPSDQATFRQLAANRYDLHGETAGSLASQRATQRQLKEVEERLALLGSHARRLADLNRQARLAETIYANYSERVAQGHAAAALDRAGASNLRSIEAPGVPMTPIGLRPAVKIAIAGLLGLLAGLCVGAWFDRRQAQAVLAADGDKPARAPADEVSKAAAE